MKSLVFGKCVWNVNNWGGSRGKVLLGLWSRRKALELWSDRQLGTSNLTTLTAWPLGTSDSTTLTVRPLGTSNLITLTAWATRYLQLNDLNRWATRYLQLGDLNRLATRYIRYFLSSPKCPLQKQIQCSKGLNHVLL